MKVMTLLITLIIAITFTSIIAMANDDGDQLYGSKIDEKIAFYQKQVHLVDSDYEILSDIGYSAIRKIVYLRENRYQLIDEMGMNPKIGTSVAKMNNFIGSRLTKLDNGIIMEAYSTEE